MDFDFKVPFTIPQDLLLIQDLIGPTPPFSATAEHAPDSLDSSDDSTASTSDEVESEDEVEADLALHDEGSGISAATSDLTSPSDSEPDSNPSSDSEEDNECEVSQQKKLIDDPDDEESGVMASTSYLQTKNEVPDTNVVVPDISEVEPCDTLEKVGDIMNIVGNTVIVKGLPIDHVNTLSQRALDAESLLVFEDRKVLGYIYETFGPTSRPLYQVKFNQDYPLETDKVWLSREVFHVPKRSHFVFVEQLKKLRGSDASNIHDEEPAEDEVEFSDDEKEAAFKAERKRRGRSVSSSRQSTPARLRANINDVVQNIYSGSNPYEAYGPYDDGFHMTGPSRPPPVPYDDPYADVPTSDFRGYPMGTNSESGREPNGEGGGDSLRPPGGRASNRGARGRGYRNRQPWSSSRRGNCHTIASQRTFDSDADQFFLQTSRIMESATEHGQISHSIAPDPPTQPASNAWLAPETCQQPFIQPHINPRFASIFGLNLPPGSWMPQNPHDHAPQPQHLDDVWTMYNAAGSKDQWDTYRPM